MLCLDLLDPPAPLHGAIARRLLEVRPCLFVGSLSRRAIEQIWESVASSRTRAALLVYAAKTENGISMKTFGEHRFELVDNFGLQLVRQRSRGAASAVSQVVD